MKYNNYLEKRRDHEDYMLIALRAAEEAKSKGNLPVGAVLVFPNDASIVEGDSVFTEHDATNHAEMNVMRKAVQMTGRSLKDCVLYTTLESCAMCASAAGEHGIKEVIFGAYDQSKGFISSGVLKTSPIAHKGGVLGIECCDILPARLKEHASSEQLVTKKQLDRKKIMEGISYRLRQAIENGDQEEEQWINLIAYQLNIGIFT